MVRLFRVGNHVFETDDSNTFDPYLAFGASIENDTDRKEARLILLRSALPQLFFRQRNAIRWASPDDHAFEEIHIDEPNTCVSLEDCNEAIPPEEQDGEEEEANSSLRIPPQFLLTGRCLPRPAMEQPRVARLLRADGIGREEVLQKELKKLDKEFHRVVERDRYSKFIEEHDKRVAAAEPKKKKHATLKKRDIERGEDVRTMIRTTSRAMGKMINAWSALPVQARSASEPVGHEPPRKARRIHIESNAAGTSEQTDAERYLAAFQVRRHDALLNEGGEEEGQSSPKAADNKPGRRGGGRGQPKRIPTNRKGNANGRLFVRFRKLTGHSVARASELWRQLSWKQQMAFAE